jgi:PadR family transcriptional regulator PadR
VEAMMKLLTRTEEIILAAVWILKENAYGIAINQFINGRTGLNWKFGSIYTPLGRLVKNGYIRTHEGAPTPERGGRRKIYYELTKDGLEALQEIQRIHNSVWSHMPALETRGKNE